MIFLLSSGTGQMPRQYNRCIYGSCRSTLGTLFWIGPNDLGIIVRYIAGSPNIHEIIFPLTFMVFLIHLILTLDIFRDVEIGYELRSYIVKRNFKRIFWLRFYPIIAVVLHTCLRFIILFYWTSSKCRCRPLVTTFSGLG